MKELIKITQEDGFQTVNARELHTFLNVGRDFNTWIKDRIKKYGFEENLDFSPILGKSNGGRKEIIYSIILDMAKELCMVENNDRGREARRYFIACENELKAKIPVLPNFNDPVIAARSWADAEEKRIIAEKLVIESEKKIKKDAPKVEFFNTVADSRDCFEMSKVAKLIKKDIGRNQLFDFLRNENILRKDNEPYQKYIEMKWFIIVEQEHKKPNGSANVNLKTLVTQKGIDKIIKLLDANL